MDDFQTLGDLPNRINYKSWSKTEGCVLIILLYIQWFQ